MGISLAIGLCNGDMPLNRVAFYDWIDYNEVAFLIHVVTRMGL